MAGLLEYGREYMTPKDTRSSLAQVRGLLGAAGDVYGAAASTAGRYARDNPLEAAALLTSPIPVVGDAMGLLSDAKMYATDPESRTAGNMAMSALGALPFVPAMGVIKNAGLDMSQAARMARAREMGFDTSRTFYHGSPDARGIKESGFATMKERMPGGDGRRGGPYFFTDDRRIASSYANPARALDYQAAEPAVIDAYLARGRDLWIDVGGDTFDGIDTKKILGALDDNERAVAEKFLDGFPSRPRERITTDMLGELARNLGYDSASVRNVHDAYINSPKTKPSTVVMMFDPSNIRSPQAAFDPAKRNSADLLASMGGLGLLGAASYPYEGE